VASENPACLDEAVKAALSAEQLPGKRVLDFGCGDGETGIWMAIEGAEVYLLDFRHAVVGAALERAREAGVARRVRGIVAEGDRLDMFADSGFDLAFLRTMPSRSILAEIARALKPGARLVLAASHPAVPEELSPWFGAVRILWPPRTGWLSRLTKLNKKPGGAVITARRAG
jgi:ubiquinone/menaquinone biosynthesis C-methylase UbiE